MALSSKNVLSALTGSMYLGKDIADKATGRKASAVPNNVKQNSDLAYYINGAPVSDSALGQIANMGSRMADIGKDAMIDPTGVNNNTYVYPVSGNTNVSLTNDNSALANAISSAASQLSNVYQGYVNAQAAAANAANAASKEAQQAQFNYNKQLMDLQNAETRNLMQWSMDYNTSSAKEQRDWEEKMSNTAYQRAVADLRSAGLNPILAYTNGAAQTPSGATASPVSGSGAGGSVGTYSGASYHINDTMSLLGATLGTIGQFINSGKAAETGTKLDKAILNVGDSIVNAFKSTFSLAKKGVR